MSRFDDEARRDLRGIYADAGELADYQGKATTATDIMVIVDKGFEVQEDNQISMHEVTVCVQVSDVPTSQRNDVIVLPERTWTVQRILEDDGHERRLWVS